MVAVAITALVFCFSMMVRDGSPPAFADESLRDRRTHPPIMERRREQSPRLSPESVRCCCDRICLLNERVESIQIDWLHEMMIEADVVALAQIIFHSETGQRDSENRMVVPQLFHQFVSASVRQADVANQ